MVPHGSVREALIDTLPASALEDFTKAVNDLADDARGMGNHAADVDADWADWLQKRGGLTQMRLLQSSTSSPELASPEFCAQEHPEVDSAVAPSLSSGEAAAPSRAGAAADSQESSVWDVPQRSGDAGLVSTPARKRVRSVDGVATRQDILRPRSSGSGAEGVPSPFASLPTHTRSRGAAGAPRDVETAAVTGRSSGTQATSGASEASRPSEGAASAFPAVVAVACPGGAADGGPAVRRSLAEHRSSAAEYASRSLRAIEQDVDPSVALPGRVASMMGSVYDEVAVKHGMPRMPEKTFTSVAQAQLLQGPPSRLEEFFGRLTEETYDADALMAGTGLDIVHGAESTCPAGATYLALKSFFQDFLLRCVNDEFEDEATLDDFLAKLPLDMVTSKHSSVAFKRVSECSGLPPDGHALFSVVQGKVAYFHFGADREVGFKAIDKTDSEWQLPNHRCSIFLIGASATGKDTLISIAKACGKPILDHPATANLPCMNHLVVGHPTYRGLLSALQQGRTVKGTCCLMWYNSEIKQCIGTNEKSIREEHFTQLAEGTEVGKRNKDEDVLVLPNLWFLIGAQPEALAERFGATDNGRLRAFCVHLDARQCLEIPFATKFLCRKASFQIIAALQRHVVASQQARSPAVKKMRTPQKPSPCMQRCTMLRVTL